MVSQGRYGGCFHGASVVGRHLSGVHQFGAAGLAAGVGVAEHAGGVRRARFLGGRHFHHHRPGHGGVQPAERPADAQTGRRAGDGAERASDGAGAAGLFAEQVFPRSVSLCHSLRAGRGQRGRGAEQLRGPSLRQPPHELAALHVGRGHHRRAVCDGIRPHRRAGLERGLPLHRHFAVRHHAGGVPQPAVVEKARCADADGGHGGGRWAGAATQGGYKYPRGEGRDGGLLLLLRRGADDHAVGEQLSGPRARRGRGCGRRLCQSFLHWHHRGSGAERLFDHALLPTRR